MTSHLTYDIFLTKESLFKCTGQRLGENKAIFAQPYHTLFLFQASEYFNSILMSFSFVGRTSHTDSPKSHSYLASGKKKVFALTSIAVTSIQKQAAIVISALSEYCSSRVER